MRHSGRPKGSVLIFIRGPIPTRRFTSTPAIFSPDGPLSNMPYTPILATLGYILSADRQRVLLIHRNRRPEDAHFGKYNGLGGKLEAGEDVVTGMCREIREESGLECQSLRL